MNGSRSLRAPRALLLAAGVLALLFVACGGGDGDRAAAASAAEQAQQDDAGSSPSQSARDAEPEADETDAAARRPAAEDDRASDPSRQGETAQTDPDDDDSDPTSGEQEEQTAADPIEVARREGPPAPYDNAFALQILRTLTVEIGPRVQGTAGELEAAEFLAATLRGFGYVVELQDFPTPVFRVDSVSLIADGDPIDTSVLTLSAGGELAARVVVVPGLGSPEDFAEVDVRGAVALVRRGILFFQEKVDNAAAAGAAAILISNNESGPFQGSLSTSSEIPALAISQAAGDSLRARSAAGTIEIQIAIEGGANQIRSQNVIARPADGECAVIVGGHYDTVIDVPGANDNGSGTSLVMELARAYAGADGGQLACFVAFGAEEGVNGSPGIAGSAALVDAFEASGELDAVTAMLNLDVAAVGNALILVGDSGLTSPGVAIAEDLSITARVGSLPAGSGSDHFNFQAAGVPVLFPTILGGPIHIPGDNFDAVQPEVLENVGRLAHALLACLLLRAGAELEAPAACPF